MISLDAAAARGHCISAHQRSSMALDPNLNSVNLPDELRSKFAALEQRLWNVETAAALAMILAALFGSYLLQFISDRCWDTPVWARVFLPLAALSLIALAVWRWTQHWIWRRRDLRALSNLVQKKYRRLGDRLLGIVELVEEEHHVAGYSPELYRAAIKQVAADAVPLDFSEAVDVRPAQRGLFAAAGLFALALLPALVVPAASWNSLCRWAMPMAAIARHTLVTLEGVAAQKIVPHGESFEVTASVNYRSFWKPARALVRFDRQPFIEAKVEQGQIRIRVPGQIQNGALTIQVGDATQSVAIVPTHRPALKELAASVELPAYLRYPSATEPVQNGTLKLLEGSSVKFQGKATRALAEGEVRLQGRDAEALKVDTDRFESGPATISEAARGGFTFRDQLGLESAAPWPLAIETQSDAPPQPELPELPRELALLETEVLNIKVAVKDDYGVREFGLRFDLLTNGVQTNSLTDGDFKDQALTPRQKKLEGTFAFSPSVLKIPANTSFEVAAFATDFFPDRQPVETPAYRIHVVDNATHAELVRQKLEALAVQLEEVTRLQEKIANETRDLKELSPEKLANEVATEKLSALAEDQKQAAANLDQLAREGQATMREAARNPEFTEESLREWNKDFQQMKQVAKEKMPKATGSLKSAQQNAQPKNAEARSKDVAEAQEKQEEILSDLAQMQKKMNQGMDQLQALTLAQRLRRLGTDEQEIAERIQKVVPETVGLLPDEVPPKFKRFNATQADNQDAAQKESQVVQGEISRFFERTRKPNYEEVTKAMTEARTGDELDRVRGLIQENISMEAMRHLTNWSERFNEWAAKLEPKKKDSKESDGQGESDDDGKELLKHLMTLLRLREREVAVRGQTRALEKKKPDAPLYGEGAAKLAESQQKMRTELGEVQRENKIVEINPALNDAADRLASVEEFLRKPQTDKLAEAAETKAVEALSDVINLINEQAQKASGKNSQQTEAGEEAAAMIQMMSQPGSANQGMAMSPSPGGSLAGGSTDRAAAAQTGESRGKAAEARKVGKASGLTGNIPTEFREALENYFNAVEKEAN
ncbi:MAG: hypothetical protein HY043_08765 [Verrucomicrobia bacterium]|nr:hypothetical protein [Verrucomicrobiota bacterium]